MKKAKLAKTLCAILITCQFAFIAYLLTNLYPDQFWKAMIGFIILAISLPNALLIFKDK